MNVAASCASTVATLSQVEQLHSFVVPRLFYAAFVFMVKKKRKKSTQHIHSKVDDQSGRMHDNYSTGCHGCLHLP